MANLIPGTSISAVPSTSLSVGQEAATVTGPKGDVIGVVPSYDRSPDFVQVTPVDVDVNKIVSSMPSAVAFHSTLHEDFDLRAVGVYNYFTDDELNPTPEYDTSADVVKLPRYVRLTWNTAKLRQVLISSMKGMRQPDPRQTGVGPILPVITVRGGVANGYVAPGTVAALLVPPVSMPEEARFNEDVFLSDVHAAGQSAADYIDGGPYHVQPLPISKTRTRVNFIDPSIAGAVSEKRIAVSDDHTHLASIGSISKLIAGLEVVSEFNQDVQIRNPPPKFLAPPDSPSLAYTGYVIERYELDRNGGMALTRIIDIEDPSVGVFYDTQVAFGGNYAYRIRSFVQWSRDSDVNFLGKSTLDRMPLFDTTVGNRTKIASFYAGDWSDWSQTQIIDTVLPDPPDELIVRPMSAKGMVDIVWKMPNDPQGDIHVVRLLRATIVADRVSDWKQLGEFVAANGRYVDRDVSPYETLHTSYMYAMYSVSYHGERSVLSERVEARLTDRVRYLGEEPLRQIAPRGAAPMAHAMGLPHDPRVDVVADSRVTLYIRGSKSALPLFDRSYVVEVQSLSTGERAELHLSVDSTDVDMSPGGKGRRT